MADKAAWTGKASRFLGGAVQGVVIINLIVAGLSFFKDVLMAMYMGTSLEADALTLAYFIPDSIGNNLLGAGIGVACVPIFSRLRMLQPGALSRTISRTVRNYVLVALLVLAILYAMNGWLIDWLTRGSETAGLADSTTRFMSVLLPTIPFFILAAIGGAVLQSHERYVVPAATSLLFNACFFLGVLLPLLFMPTRETGGTVIASSIAIGTIGMALLVWWDVRRTGRLHSIGLIARQRTIPKGEHDKSSVQQDQRDIRRIFVPYLLILLGSQAVYLVERYLVAQMDTGSVAALNYAFRLAQFPIWVFAAAVTSVLLPSLSQDAALQRTDRLHGSLRKAFRSMLLITLPISCLFYVCREPIVSVLFQRGAFNEASLAMTSELLAGFALTIVGQAVTAICLRYYLALGRLWLPTWITLGSAAITIAADYVLIHQWGTPGLGYGSALGSVINAVFMMLLLGRSIPGLYSGWLTRGFQLAAVQLPFIALLLGIMAIRFYNPLLQSGLIQALYMAVTGIIACAVYAGCLYKGRLVK
jgi:putative peptidoglycan lipid II flippase